MMRLAVCVALLCACVCACQREKAPVDPTVELCIKAVDSLGPDLADVQTKLRDALARDRLEAARLMRESVELMLVTRELQCAIVERARVEPQMKKLEATRAAFDALLVATTSPVAPKNEAELVDRFSRALLSP